MSALDWYDRRTTSADQWPSERIVDLKGSHRITVVIPARDEEATVGEVVRQLRCDLVERAAVVDELVVMDSLSRDATAERARAAGARVVDVRDVAPDLGSQPGKGEALWKSLIATTGDIVVFVDADLTEWSTDFVLGLVGPLLTDPRTMLVKGFYDRILDMGSGVSAEGGRVTELVARPLLALHWPELAGVVQPLAGEWAIRRSVAEELPFPVGYGVEMSTLLDVTRLHGLDAVAQVDLGRRAHKHQNIHDLGAMAAEILTVADRRLGRDRPMTSTVLRRPTRERGWEERVVPTAERPPVASLGLRG